MSGLSKSEVMLPYNTYLKMVITEIHIINKIIGALIYTFRLVFYKASMAIF